MVTFQIITNFFLESHITFPRYKQFETKLSPISRFATRAIANRRSKSFQAQNHFSIKPIAQIRCSCYSIFLYRSIILYVGKYSLLPLILFNLGCNSRAKMLSSRLMLPFLIDTKTNL
jgi:hypothetical protein